MHTTRIKWFHKWQAFCYLDFKAHWWRLSNGWWQRSCLTPGVDWG